MILFGNMLAWPMLNWKEFCQDTMPCSSAKGERALHGILFTHSRSLFTRHNSGTYNNQWMVVDTKLISLHPSPVLSANSLIVTEVLPGIVHTEDMTWYLREHGYWISYNRPFFPKIFNLSGQPALVKKYGDHYSWEKTARAEIFRRLVPTVVDSTSYQRAMRYNDFENDPVGRQGCTNAPSASNAIAERGDLTDKDAGCISDIQLQDEAQTDVKYTSVSSMQRGVMSAVAQSGPTYDLQHPFRWSLSPFAHIRHVGQPDLWHFPWVNISWNFKQNDLAFALGKQIITI